MRGLDPAQPLEDLGRHGRAAACILAHVERHQLVRCGEVALLRVVHLVEVVQALGVVTEEQRGEAQRVALADFAVVGHVGFEAEGGDARGAAVGLVEADRAEELVGGEVEDHDVVAHVHVAVVVDPLRPHAIAVEIEWRLNVLGHGGDHHPG